MCYKNRYTFQNQLGKKCNQLQLSHFYFVFEYRQRQS